MDTTETFDMSRVVKKPKWFLIGGQKMTVTAFGRIWVPEPAWPISPLTLRHEMVHLRQEAEAGMPLFVWRYATSRHWRLLYEIEAYAAEVQFVPDNFKWACQELSSVDYWWAASNLGVAERALQEALDKLKAPVVKPW